MPQSAAGPLRWSISVATALASVLAGLALSGHEGAEGAAPQVAASTDAHTIQDKATGAVPVPENATLQWLVIGGGATPSTNQFGIEADVADVQRTFAGPGGTLFSGGARALSVQVREPNPMGDPLRRRLGRFFAPRQGRNSRYRRTRLPGARIATRATVLQTISAQLRQAGDGPLLVWTAGHGDIGSAPSANGVLLWAGGRLTPVDVADLLAGEGLARTLTLIMTTCYSGGFAEMVFANADARAGPARVLSCGLFASPWDLESSGCDADPERRHHQGYARHFLPALHGLARDGEPLPRAEIDFDGDGRISLFEAHARVRMASQSADVPTSTSERWLRHAAPKEGPATPLTIPEEDAVISHLAARLRVPAGDLTRPGELARREAAQEQARQELERVQVDEDAAWHELAAELLGRWPTLDDPWHPDFDDTLRRHRQAIGDHLDGSPLMRRYETASAVTDAAGRLLDQERIGAALAERLERAVDNRLLAGRLKAKGGAAWLRWRALLRCERRVPRLQPR